MRRMFYVALRQPSARWRTGSSSDQSPCSST
jgi:hypothetical protein